MAKSRRAATATTSSATTASNLKSSKSASAAKHTKPETPSRNPSFDTEFESPDRAGGQDHGPTSEVSSPAASIDHHVDGTKVMDGTSPTMSESEDDHDETATVNTSGSHPQKGHYRLPPLSLSEYAGEQEAADPQYDYHQPISPTEDPESQWESDTGGGFHHHKRGGSDAKSMTSSSTPGSAARSRKSGPPGSRMYPRPSRQSTNFSKPNLSPNSVRRHTNNYFNSRASSASYSEMMGGGEERKAPLVLLHMSLILLPGAEEPILRKITPTMLQRGLLIEHPRSDYQLLEELIFDALGLDEPLEDKNGSDSEAEDKELSEAAAWEKSMGIRRVDGRDKWELRIYASNGLMTAGAWRKVWNEMERIDVEVGPRDWRGQTVSILLLSSVLSFVS